MHITIALTSCGRFSLLKKTVSSLSKTCDISQYEKIMTEDSRNKKHIQKIKQANRDGFLQGWKIIYTGGSGTTNQEKHHNALKKLYECVNTAYVFHCEDDWFFEKQGFDLLKLSKKILDNHQNVGIVQLRNFEKDGGYNHISLAKQERKKELFCNKKNNYFGHTFLLFRNDKGGDSCAGFSLNPGLRRTDETKKILFGSGKISRVDETFSGERMARMGLVGVCLDPGVCHHIGNTFLSTKIIEKGLLHGLRSTLSGTYNYRINAVLIQRNLLPLFRLLYQKLDLFPPIRYLMDLASYFKRRNTIKPITKDKLINTEGVEEMNIPITWFSEKKPLGISGVARLKNGDDFLEKVIESHIHFLDEIILVDNLSTDNTKEICLLLQKKYPNKIKFFEYKYNVLAPGSNERHAGNSLSSLSYYYNRCFSKSKYQYVMKLDDDNFFLPKNGKNIRNHILNRQPQRYITYWGYNLMKNQEGHVGVSKQNPHIGRYGDHGIYPVSRTTYYDLITMPDETTVEHFYSNLLFTRFGFCFLHLKYLKKNYGLTNINHSSCEKIIKMCQEGDLIKMQKITKIYNSLHLK